MSIRISPEELYFPPPLDREITNVLRLNNNSTTGGVVAYKVKTTAPQRYCVKPRVGYVKPQSEVNIHITLQPQKESFERIKDKFLFEFMRFTQEESDNISIQDLTVNWTRYESKIVKKQKLKCQFASPSPNANATVIFGESGAVSSSQADRSPDHSRRSWEPQVKETTNLTNEVNITTEGEKEDLFVSSIQEQPIQRRDLDLPTEVIQEDVIQSTVPQNSHAQEVIQEVPSQKPDIEQIISHPTQRLEESHVEETQEVQIQPDRTQEQQDHSTTKSQEIIQHTEEPEKTATKIVNAPLDLTSETRHTVEQVRVHTAELQHKLERIEQGVNDELQSRYKMALNKMAELQSENTELHKEIKSLKAKCVSLLNSQQQSELVQRKKTDLGSVKGESTTIPSSQKQMQLQQGQPPQNPSVMWMIVALVALVFFVLGKLL